MNEDEFQNPQVMFDNMTRSLRVRIQVIRNDLVNIKHPEVYEFATDLLWEYENEYLQRIMAMYGEDDDNNDSGTEITE